MQPIWTDDGPYDESDRDGLWVVGDRQQAGRVTIEDDRAGFRFVATMSADLRNLQRLEIEPLGAEPLTSWDRMMTPTELAVIARVCVERDSADAKENIRSYRVMERPGRTKTVRPDLGLVAELAQAVIAGGGSPRQVLAKAFFVTPYAVDQWLRAARAQGLLAPASGARRGNPNPRNNKPATTN